MNQPAEADSASPQADPPNPESLVREIEITNKKGLHARA